MAKKKYHNGMKRKSGGMISEDYNAIANLPQDVKMASYPKFMYGLDPDLDDTISGIDSQIYADDSQMKRHISKSKY